MSNGLKSILKNPIPPEWKEADMIVPRLWLGTMTDNQHARRRGITEVMCISKDPYGDLQREGFTNALDIDSTIFTIETDNKGNLLPVFGEAYNAIENIRQGGESLLIWDVGGGVAVLASYLIKKYSVPVPEAMGHITRTRLRRPKPTPYPSKSIIDMLNNKNFLVQLEMWRACKCNLFENTIRNPTEPPEQWIIVRIKQRPKRRIDIKGKGKAKEVVEEEEEEDEGSLIDEEEQVFDCDDDDDDDYVSVSNSKPTRKPASKPRPSLYQQPNLRRSTSHLPHRLSMIAEAAEEEAQHRPLSLTDEEEQMDMDMDISHSYPHRLSTIAEVEEEARRLSLIDDGQGGREGLLGRFGFEGRGLEEEIF